MKNDHYHEEYEITYQCVKPDGYTLWNSKETIELNLHISCEEKCNHNKAKAAFLRRNPGFTVTNVTYI